jgi:hypothetical protein
MEGSMQQEYEVRIVMEGRTRALIELNHINDHAAVRSATKLANGSAFEVWRGLDCIYSKEKNRDQEISAITSLAS